MTLPCLVLAAAAAAGAADQTPGEGQAPVHAPLSVFVENPRYFVFRGKPTVLVTSGEHYGAVLNLDFDYRVYLDVLKRCGLNLTRTFSGTYREVPGSFRIRANTLAPAPGRFACPWARRGEKFDLDDFDEAYFERLKDFLAEAGRRGIVVEYVNFCPLYEEELWAASPMNGRNNVNGLGRCPRDEVFTLKHPELLKRQLAFVRKAVAELNGFDNLYFEICNEPYFGGVTLDWQRRVADTIVDAEKDLPFKHLVAQNIANGNAKVVEPHPAVSVFNFHYASPPEAVPLNEALRKPIAFDETGFKGTEDRVYRRQAWEFLLAGGGVFSNLDYSFTVDREDGSAKVEDPTPGGGGRRLREQVGLLRSLVEGMGLEELSPDNRAIKAVEPASLRGDVSVIASRRRGEFLLYAASGPKLALTLDLPPGNYQVQWIDPRDGRTILSRGLDATDGGRPVRLESPDFAEDLVVRIRAGREK
ncbi:hypothetical protein OJF2_18530 [Aquisphaera giovannonii]|uniref:Glycoside hydrolase family 5 domain-containing protein n=1 Tax=Aquisphaera giovannonii TaxID=406548 RepID=A0A5B9VYG2_9BACT|nr:hypothetical protein [Aquisphaera giovannonii]QEH33352.1 hypothetical protein OJF2_18530 [Aquisphaera giovannonii]